MCIHQISGGCQVCDDGMQVAERFLGHLLATRQYVKAAALTPDLLKVQHSIQCIRASLADDVTSNDWRSF